ncbi:MAG: DEAD/DEAH box helicase family protein [Thermoflexales bacterium]|nr:DEAD/DEAH box helicase family protein [Thermoflexales bacterium]
MPRPRPSRQQAPPQAPPTSPMPEDERRGGELFVVDNSDEQWQAARYLSEWCDVARQLDVATGYFEIGALLALDGQWQKLERIRILMGDEVSIKTKQAFEAALGKITLKLDHSLESEKEKNDFLGGVPAIVAALQSGRIVCRVYRERKFHAKAYITHARFDVMGATALVGSSNFTHPGLHENIELNVRLQSGVKDLQAWYEAYWEQAEDVTPNILRTIQPHVRDYTPFEVYAKALHEFFRGHELTATEWEQSQSRVYPLLDQYQREGYHALLKYAGRYNGALLCDSVGLGKTFIGMMLIERLLHERKRVALFVPKAARQPVWESKLERYLPGLASSRFGNNLVIYNHTDLLRGNDFPAYMDEVKRQADVVIIDEAHHFRNQAAQRYRQLYDMLEGKQVYLITATPINNSLLDLQHLIELFSRRQADYFRALGIHSLPGHFRTLDNALERLTGGQSAGVEISMHEAERVLGQDDLFRSLVVQRSRAYARASQEQHGGGQVVFPDREPPKVGEYSLRETYGQLLDDLERAFRKDKPLLSLAIYYPLAYPVGSDAGFDPMQKGRQAQVVGLIRTQLLKRFESSTHAFRATCERLLLKLWAFVQANSITPAEQRRLERWQGQHAGALARVRQNQDLLAEDEEEDVLPVELLEAVETLRRDEYRVGEILDETYLDLDELIVFLGDLADFTPGRDSKLQALIELLGEPPLSQHKVLIFTEYMETAQYLYDELKREKIGPLDVVHSHVERNRGRIITAFSPYYNDSSSRDLALAGVGETRVLISTDVLSEGLNLQDATLLINYDLHWNPVRLMQRIGRVDRRLDLAVEEKMLADHPDWGQVRRIVRYWNFLPPDELDRLLALYERVAHKVLRISTVFGIEGRKLIKPEDHYKALKEFNLAYDGAPSPVEAMRLAYYDLLAAHPGLEERLARLPLRVFSGRSHPSEGARGVFFCYALPALDQASGQWTLEAGYTQWYLYDLATEKIQDDAEWIETVIRSQPDTPRRCVVEAETLREVRKKVEKHIKNTYLKSAVAPQGVKPALKAWIELS